MAREPELVVLVDLEVVSEGRAESWLSRGREAVFCCDLRMLAADRKGAVVVLSRLLDRRVLNEKGMVTVSVGPPPPPPPPLPVPLLFRFDSKVCWGL